MPELPREQWASLAVRDRMLPVDRSLVVDAEEPLDEALRDLAPTFTARSSPTTVICTRCCR